MIEAIQTAKAKPIFSQFNAASLAVSMNPRHIRPNFMASPASHIASGEKKEKETSRASAETYDQKVLRERSGYRIDNISIKSGREDETPETKRENEERSVRAFADAFSSDGFSFTVDSVTKGLSGIIARSEAMLKMNEGFRDIKDKDMLRLDANGNRIAPEDDPEGKYVVRTLEEKHAYEEKIRACTSLYSQDEVTLGQDGRLVLIETMYQDIELTAQIENTRQTMTDVREGRVKPDAIPDAMKAEIVARQHEGLAKETPSLQGNGPEQPATAQPAFMPPPPQFPGPKPVSP